MNEIVKVRCLKHVYPDKTEVSICGLDFIVNRGDRIVILGPNGAGKTTLLSHILGLLKPMEGQVSVFDVSPSKEFKQVRKKIGVVFQNVDEQIIGPTVFDDIAFSLRNEGQKTEVVKARVEEVAEILDISHLLNKIPHYLSGGQKKKVALAGAMAMSPQLLIMDEPFDGLDPKSKREMIEIINSLNRNMGVTTIVTTHDINIVPHIADYIYILNKGNIVSSGRPEEIFKKLDILTEANLEPPILIQLFTRLKEKGLQVDIPISIEQAEEEINRLVSTGSK
ncbi:MAG: cobalt/nickel transport system ATP-binding protein [Clostridiales bacterium]|nr:cobalt/nickel transport system ATP-binding protein [Clostridiales bacterium]MDK2934442.1 cobalt/nickel transport system ATP-binding protein [Clostridiales bacterium]